MNQYNFNGRPDGIGNRVEELILLEAFCNREKIKINYIWNNKWQYRSYEIWLTGNSCNIIKEANPKIPFKWSSDAESNFLHQQNFSETEILNAAKNIKSIYPVTFKNNIKPIGIHVRGTDRIGRDHEHFMKDYKEFNLYISKTIAFINNSKPKYIFVCADDERYKKIFQKNISKKIEFINPVVDQNLPSDYRDFFALSACESIIMCSKFSTFAITASMIANIPLISFHKNESISNRYKAIFKYDLSAPKFPNKIYIKPYTPSLVTRLKKKFIVVKNKIGKTYRTYFASN